MVPDIKENGCRNLCNPWCFAGACRTVTVPLSSHCKVCRVSDVPPCPAKCLQLHAEFAILRYPGCYHNVMIAETIQMASKLNSILLVEDDVSLRRSVGEFLKDNGYSLYTAGTMLEAWETIRAVRPGVCLLDLNLPDGSGLDLLRHIVREQASVRVIVMTAFPLQHLQPQYPPGPLVAWLTKPVSPAALLEAIEKADDTLPQ